MKRIITSGFCIFITFLLIGGEKQNSNNTKPLPTILFICEHGAPRSTIAANCFNKLAQGQELNYRVIFRGINPDSTLGTAARNGLIKDGLVVNGWKPPAVAKHEIDALARS